MFVKDTLDLHKEAVYQPEVAARDPDDRRDSLTARGVKLQLGASVHDPVDPMGKMFFNILAN